MFAYITGTLASASPDEAILDVNGLGYLVYISLFTFEKLPKIGEICKLHTSTVIREDSQKTYGFFTLEERNFFEQLNNISGIGSRLSLAILGHMSLEDLHLAVEHANTKAISKVPGIGKKMAERLIIELRDKFKAVDKQKISLSSKSPQGISADAISALINLGYSPLDAQKAVQTALKSKKEEPLLPELISLALKK